MRQFLLLAVLLCTIHAFAGKVSGHIADAKGQALGFTSIVVKGTTQGTAANSSGYYSLSLKEGEYTLIAQHVGYKSVEKKITVGKDAMVADFTLPEQQYELNNVVVKKGEDPAYEIIRNTIKQRKQHEKENKKYETEVYIKGQLKLRNYPDKFLGQKVDFEDGDTSKRKIIFLSETVAKYYVDEPKKRVEVISSKVSGQSNGFGFSNPQIISFYENHIKLGDLNPRGFISPISDNALHYYKYKFAGTFFENDKMVNRIKVMPKRKYEPLFNGYINIIENEWRIHSLQLVLYKENQMQLVDTLRIEQLYVPYRNTWIIKQQTIYPAIKFFGFDATGNFVQVYDKFNLNPTFSNKLFDNTILKVEDSANKKPLAYWDTIRPVPLLEEEVKDYKKKDSLEQKRKDPHYLDSLDRRRNKLSPFGLLLTGETFSNEKKKSTLSINSIFDGLNYNTVEGGVYQLALTYHKRFSEVRRNNLTIAPNFRYGFSNHHFNAYANVTYNYGKKFSSISFGGGRRVYQFDNANPVNPRMNTTATLHYYRNFMKIYEAGFGRVSYSKELGKGFMVTVGSQYQDRMPLENTSDASWRKIKGREYTPNFTQPRHQALTASASMRWRPGSRYIELPERKFSIGSRYPTFNLSYAQGVKNVLGSDVDYGKWNFTVSDNMSLQLLGELDYSISAGGFISSKAVFFPDFQHYHGNQLVIASPYLSSFQLMHYYAYSNAEKFYSTAHVEYHLNGFLTNKIPFFRKLNWFLVGGTNLLYINNNTHYAEAFVGLENILKVIRVDAVKSIDAGNKAASAGVRILLPIVGE